MENNGNNLIFNLQDKENGFSTCTQAQAYDTSSVVMVQVPIRVD